jgi:hypothetical protein
VAVGLLLWQINEEKIKLAENNLQTPLVGSGSLLDGSLAKLDTQLRALNEHFLVASTTVPFLEQLENTAKITKTVFKINQAGAQDNLTLNFSVLGSYSTVNQFLGLLEKFPYALRINRLDLRAGDKGSWQGDFIVTVMTQ